MYLCSYIIVNVGSAFAHWYCLPRHWCSVYFSLYFSVLLIYGSFYYYVSSLLISYSTVLKLLPVSPVEFFISEIVVLFSRSSMILFFLYIIQFSPVHSYISSTFFNIRSVFITAFKKFSFCLCWFLQNSLWNTWHFHRVLAS